MDQCNTKFWYLYRDASNNKKMNSVVVKGTFQASDEETVKAALSEGEYFIPRQIGLPEERFGELNEDDHCWFEYIEMTPTSEAVTVDLTVAQLIERFTATGSSGWHDDVYAISVS